MLNLNGYTSSSSPSPVIGMVIVTVTVAVSIIVTVTRHMSSSPVIVTVIIITVLGLTANTRSATQIVISRSPSLRTWPRHQRSSFRSVCRRPAWPRPAPAWRTRVSRRRDSSTARPASALHSSSTPRTTTESSSCVRGPAEVRGLWRRSADRRPRCFSWRRRRSRFVGSFRCRCRPNCPSRCPQLPAERWPSTGVGGGPRRR